MNSVDFITILGNISHSLYPVQRVITGGAYVLGVLFVLSAVVKIRKIADKRTQSSSQEKVYTPLMYMIFGMAFIYLPTALDTMANTAFGVGNVLTYSSYNATDVNSIVGVFVRTAGIIWFIRGSVLVAHSSNPGTKDGPKGLVFIVAGIFAINFDNTISMVNAGLEYLIRWTLVVKSAQGY